MTTLAGRTAAITEDDLECYLGHLAAPDEDGALAQIDELLRRGVPPDRVLMDLVARAQQHVGREWAANRWSVAAEHAATHVSERVVAAIARVDAGRRGHRGELVMSCVDGEWHSLPARLCAEVLRLHGWSVRFLGANVPTLHLIAYLQQTDPVALAVSCSLPTRLPTAHLAIQAAQEAGVPVLAGGAGFGPDGRWARRLGADGAVASAEAALAALDDWPPEPGGRAELAHLADEEYVLVVKRRAELVDATLAELGRRFPPLHEYTPYQRQSTVDDLTHIVDFLAAAVYVDDPDLFAGFAAWLAEILRARRVPPASVALAFDALASTLYDSPRVQRILAAGRSQL